MRWKGDVAIITGRYLSSDESTIMELWSRARNGQSVLLRVHGVRPWFEITPHGKWKDDETHPDLPETYEGYSLQKNFARKGKKCNGACKRKIESSCMRGSLIS